MKKLLLIFSIAFASCQTVRVGGGITSFSQNDSITSIGFYVHGDGQLSSKLDSLLQGYPITLGDQILQATYTDTYFDINGVLNLKRK